MTNKTITISRETFQGLLEDIACGGYDNNSRTDMFHRVLGEPWETVTMCEADARLLLCGFSYVNEHREELLAALRRADEKEHSDHIAAEFEREGRKLPPGFHNCTAEKAVTGIFIPPAESASGKDQATENENQKNRGDSEVSKYWFRNFSQGSLKILTDLHAKLIILVVGKRPVVMNMSITSTNIIGYHPEVKIDNMIGGLFYNTHCITSYSHGLLFQQNPEYCGEQK